MDRTRSAAAGCRILSRKALKVTGGFCEDDDEVDVAGDTDVVIDMLPSLGRSVLLF